MEVGAAEKGEHLEEPFNQLAWLGGLNFAQLIKAPFQIKTQEQLCSVII